MNDDLPMRDVAEITPQQVEMLEILWSLGQATVAEVRDLLPRGEALARTTVTTVLSRMEAYGWVSRERVGREFIYRAEVIRPQVRAAHVRGILQSLFTGDLPSFVSHALREGEWEDEDLDRIKEMISAHRRRGRGRRGTSA